MRQIAKLAFAAAMIAAAMSPGASLLGQDRKGAPVGSPSAEIKRSEESPFGGPPPPMGRGLAVKGATCATPSGNCIVDPAQPVGLPCACPAAAGTKAEGRIKR